MSDKIEQASNTVAQVGAAIAVTPFFTMQWWNENSAGIVAICAAIGAVVSIISFLFGQWHRRQHRKK